jgi:hypothetical protein
MTSSLPGRRDVKRWSPFQAAPASFDFEADQERASVLHGLRFSFQFLSTRQVEFLRDGIAVVPEDDRRGAIEPQGLLFLRQSVSTIENYDRSMRGGI